MDARESYKLSLAVLVTLRKFVPYDSSINSARRLFSFQISKKCQSKCRSDDTRDTFHENDVSLRIYAIQLVERTSRLDYLLTVYKPEPYQFYDDSGNFQEYSEARYFPLGLNRLELN